MSYFLNRWQAFRSAVFSPAKGIVQSGLDRIQSASSILVGITSTALQTTDELITASSVQVTSGALISTAMEEPVVLLEGAMPVTSELDYDFPEVTLTFSTGALGSLDVILPAVGVIETTDYGAGLLVTGGHTLYGAAIPYAQDRYWWVTVDGVGADPDLAGMTGTEVALTGSGPFAADTVAAACVTAGGGGYTLSRSGATITVSDNGIDVAATIAVFDGLTTFYDRGAVQVLGAERQNGGNNTSSGNVGWVQLDNLPTTPHRIVFFEVFRGNNVGNPVRMALAYGGTGTGDPEGGVPVHERAMGNSGSNTWHREWLDHDEIVERDGSDTLGWIGLQGDGSSSSVRGAANITDGLVTDGAGDTLWVTGTTSGSATAFDDPINAVTSEFTYGMCVRVGVQFPPYQDDGQYVVIAGAREGVHDQALLPGGTDVDNIFVGWLLEFPTVEGLYVDHMQVMLAAAGVGGSNYLRFEGWDPDGGDATFAGDTNNRLLGLTADGQGTGWSEIYPTSPLTGISGTELRVTVKGAPVVGEEGDTALEVDVGGFGVQNLGYPAYSADPNGLEDTELEVQLVPAPGDTPETALNFDPEVATADPNDANGTIITPGNVGMWNIHLHTPAVVVEETP